MSQHHFDVATWKIVGKKEISCNVQMPQPEENKWKANDVATSLLGRDTKLKVMKTLMSRHNSEVATSALNKKMSRHHFNVATTNQGH